MNNPKIIYWIGPNGQRVMETEGFQENYAENTNEMKCVKAAASLAKKMGSPGDVKAKEDDLRNGKAIDYITTELCG